MHILRRRAISEPSETIYSFLLDGYSDQVGLTCGELDQRARSIASHLNERANPGERAVLMYSAGLEFIAAFFACLYAGVIAVPAFPPRNRRTAPRIDAILCDADARLCLTESVVLDRTRALVDSGAVLAKMNWIATDQISETAAGNWSMPSLRHNSLAFIQYTSGSTSTPRGVMVSHGNLIQNLSFLCDGRGHSGIVSWLPLFHDAGLIYAMLQSLYAGVPCILMPPASFLQRPVRWLNALSESRYSTSVAPNFAYELCIERISEAEKETLDLSHWTMALNGAEPVKSETLERFASAFACCGFRPECLKPAYGLAEATLGVAISKDPGGYQTRRVERAELAENRVVECDKGEGQSIQLVGCGSGAPGHRIAIVNPESLCVCGSLEVGEIWVSGPSVAGGYWRRPEESAATFQARLRDSDEGPFLRTGDLGFVDGGELYITGRLKDLIIIRGGNHYPQDIEYTVQDSQSSLQRDAGAVFSTESGGEDRLIIVQELVRHTKADMGEVLASIRENVAEFHGISVGAILLVKPQSVPKTSSGKIQRRKTRELFLEGKLGVLAAWRAQESSESEGDLSNVQTTKGDAVFREDKISEDWLVARLSEALKLSPSEIESRVPFTRYGLDSLGAVSLAGRLQDALSRTLPASLLFDYPTIESLVRHLNHGSMPRHASLGMSNMASEPVALIGFGCRFPQADSPQEFWELLRNGVDAISEVPRERWDAEALYDPVPGVPGKANTKWGGFLKDVDMFAAEFFEISPREAAQMDPQQRLLLEVAWEALENSGIPASRLVGGRTGVFVGISGFDYSVFQFKHRSLLDAYAGTGLAHSIAANRISYFFDLRGPSVVVDTACSSSLVAIHQACESLRRGESDLALSGGVNLMLSPEITIALSHARMMASDGRCKTFDNRADGYVRGEGCAMAVLKRLSDAERDGNPILALIHGSAVNQDGRSNGLTAPNGPAQTAVVGEALRNAGIAPDEVSYVECHGTGTALGDPQEVEALQQVLNASGNRTAKCWIGSVKTNIGHLEAAAGIAGLLKVALSLKNKRLPASLHCNELNSRIRLDRSIFDIPAELVDWPPGTRRIAGVSSFGFGGTNCHVVLGEAPERPIPGRSSERSLHLLTLSAKTDTELKNRADAMATHLASQSNGSLGDICFTVNTCLDQFSRRLALVTGSCLKASEQLEEFLGGGNRNDVLCGRLRNRERKKIAFLFPGQGSQYSGIGRQLFDAYPVFRSVIEDCDDILRPLLDRPLLSVLYPDSEDVPKDDSGVYTQPALFALEYALARLWKSWGVVPDAVLGHGSGEYAAACVAGVFDFETALQLLAKQAILDDFEKFAQGAIFRTPGIPILSNVTGDWYSREVAPDARYWTGHMHESVRYASGLSKLLENGHSVFLECGPDDALVRIGERYLSDQGAERSREALWLCSLPREKPCLEGQLVAAASLYVNGFELDWSGVDMRADRRRVDLPSYGFERKSFWIGNHASEGVPNEIEMTPLERSQPETSEMDELIYQVQWIPWSLAAASIAHAKTTAGNWLILCDQNGFGEALAKLLNSHGQQTGLVFEGNEFERFSPGSWRISAADASHFQLLIQEWRQSCSNGPISGVVHLWGLNAMASEIDSGSDLRRSQVFGCEAALHLIQSMSSAAGNRTGSGKLWIVTRGARSAGEVCESTVDVRQAPLLGFGHTLALETGKLWGGLVDLDPDRTNSEIEIEIVTHALLAAGGEDELLIRGGRTFVPRLQHSRLKGTGGITLDRSGTYLITGGLGGIGLALSKWLVEQGARRLALLGRTKLPSRSSWKRLISGQKHPLWAKLEAILNIERLGASVLYVPLDVSSERAVSTFLKRYDLQAWPPVRGVFHCAGVAEDTTVARMSIDALRRVFEAKAAGAWNLFRHLADHPVEFFAFFSSAASVVGSYGGANYAAANSFLDSLAPHMLSRGVRALSVSWGPWAGTGMVDPDREEKLRRQGVEPVLPAAALAILSRLLAERGSVHTLVAKIRWRDFLSSSRVPPRALFSELHSPEVLQNSQDANDRAGGMLDLGIHTEPERKKIVIGLVAELLRIDASLIDSECNLHSLGLDSIMAVQLKHELELQFGYDASDLDPVQVSIEDLVVALESKNG